MEQIKCPKCGEVFNIDESLYASLLSQVRDKELDKRVTEREKEIRSQQQNVIENAVLKSKEEQFKEIESLKQQITELNSSHALEVEKKNNEIVKLKEDKKRAVEDAVRKEKDAVKELQGELEKSEYKHSMELQNKEKEFNVMLKGKDEEIDRLKNYKLQQSTKMVGESLEQFCENEFNKVRAAAFPTAYFEKDNKVSKSGSKGDFIFRDSADGIEYISIMFEMKNENDETKTKHKNEDFLKELDKDRKEKNCEYAILVSMLESDNDLYNRGIVDMSYRYPKMYVIRPQMLIPVITFLRNAALQSLDAKKELAEIKDRNIDVSKFEDALLDFKDKFGRNYGLANKRFFTAIEEIDKTIEHLQKVKEELLASSNQLKYANDKLDDLTIKKLTKNNETMQEKFKEAGVDISPAKRSRKKKNDIPFEE